MGIALREERKKIINKKIAEDDKKRIGSLLKPERAFCFNMFRIRILNFSKMTKVIFKLQGEFKIKAKIENVIQLVCFWNSIKQIQDNLKMLKSLFRAKSME